MHDLLRMSSFARLLPNVADSTGGKRVINGDYGAPSEMPRAQAPARSYTNFLTVSRASSFSQLGRSGVFPPTLTAIILLLGDAVLSGRSTLPIIFTGLAPEVGDDTGEIELPEATTANPLL